MNSPHNTSVPIRWLYLTSTTDINNLDLYGQKLEDESALRQPLGFIKFFTDVDECVDYITRVEDSYIILTISGRYGWRVVPHIHDISQLSAVYIICKPESEKLNKTWSTKYSKVKAVISLSRQEDYHLAIYRNHIAPLESKKKLACSTLPISIEASRIRFYENTPFNILDTTGNAYKDLSTENGSFVWMQLLIEVLLRLDTSKDIMQEFFQMCHEFDEDENSGENIFLFAALYDSRNPVEWYSKAPFVYRFLNQICRSEDIDKLMLLRILVRDMHNQLQEEQSKFIESQITVYRGQAMKLTELKYLQNHVGHFISMNSFLSTSRDRDIALFFADSIDKTDSNMKSVLYEMDCDTRRSDTKPFADIAHLSHFTEEKEILFMLGSVFRVEHVQPNETNDVWIIKMTLCGKTDYDTSNAFQSIAAGLQTTYPSLTTLGLLFQRMGDFKRATQCFQQHLDLVENDDGSLRSACNHNLGNIAQEMGDYDLALGYMNRSMEIRLNMPSIEKSVMGSLYNDIGNVYNAKKDYQKALEYYKEALSFESLEENDDKLAMTYVNIGEIYRLQEKYDLALVNFNKCLTILENSRIKDGPCIAQTFRSIGTVYCSKNDYEIALLYMTKALDIEQKTLPKNHINLGYSYNNIALAYALTGRSDMAIENLKKAEMIFRVNLPIDHSTIQSVRQNIELLQSQLING